MVTFKQYLVEFIVLPDGAKAAMKMFSAKFKKLDALKGIERAELAAQISRDLVDAVKAKKLELTAADETALKGWLSPSAKK